MFKLVALCCFLASVSATPGVVVPLAYSSNVLASAPAVVSSYPSGLAYSSPVFSSAPLAYSGPWDYQHLIKKRSLAVSSYIAPSSYITPSSYIAPAAYTYRAAAPLVSSYSAVAPLASYSGPVYTGAAHLIKKRSALLVPNTYVASAGYTAPAPFVASTYAAASPIAPLWSNSLYPAAQYAHFIKKRSAPLAVATYAAPSSYSHTSRFDFQAVSPAVSYTSFTGPSPIIYSAPTYSHLI